MRLLGPASATDRTATESLLPRRTVALEVAKRLADKGIICGPSHFYAVRLLQAMGLNPDAGVLRLSFLHYTSAREMSQLLKALYAVL